ncbi:DUF2726 domain-containing protein [Peptostreptococcus porci]|uniref:DUF2726 domain-containing protein n=1 Tax=Peptostreptococcus porci TaxID=2652282 RepID=UPI002A9191AA|nr:DUF2726 domain-containing protein [Peptostreptococcus porci]MDY6233018.1 DUF2726 domain-containing protein [Peptostreptococcus porci]
MITLIVILLIIISIGIYLNLFFKWKQPPNQNDNSNNQTLNHVSEQAVQPHLKNNNNYLLSDNITDNYVPIADFAKFYKKQSIQNHNELQVYKALLKIFNSSKVYVLPQISFASIVTSASTSEYEQVNRLRIVQKRVDYAITSTDGETLFLIELDGNSHSNEDPKNIQLEKDLDRDEFWSKCGIPVIRIPLSEIINLDKQENMQIPYIEYGKLKFYIFKNSFVDKSIQNQNYISK